MPTYYLCPSCGIAIASKLHPELEGELCPGCKNLGIALDGTKTKILDKAAKELHSARPTKEVF